MADVRRLAPFRHVIWQPTPRDRRRFARAMLVGFALIGSVAAWRHGSIGSGAIAAWSAGAALAVAALIPGLGSLVHVAVYVVTGIIGFAISRVLLTIVFFAVFTPLGALLRLMGKDLLRLRRDAARSEWVPHQRRDRQSYSRRF